MLRQKEKQIINYLSKHQDRFVTSKELAEQLSCSDRTVRTYLKSLMAYDVKEMGARLEAKQGYGYRFSIVDEKGYQQFALKQQLSKNRKIDDITDRHNYILNKLIFEQEKVFFDDLVEELYVSRSTLSADFKKIRKDLLKYDLTIESRPHKGVYVSGREHDKRHFIMDYFFSGHFLKNIHQYVGEDFFNLPISFEALTIIVLDECRSESLQLSDFIIQNLVIHIALALKRVLDGFEISPINLDETKYRKEILVANRILERIQKSTAVAFPKEEVCYIALHLISKGINLEKTAQSANLEIRNDLLTVLGRLNQTNAYPFLEDFTLIEGLVTHLEVLQERLKNEIHLDNPLLGDIKSNYSEAFQITKDLVAQLAFTKPYQVSDDEIAYIALHLMAALERYKEQHKLNVLIICATGYGSAQMLKYRVTNEFGHLLNIVDLIGYYDIDDEKLANIDLIISSIDLSNLVFSVPVVTVSVFLKDDEIALIKKKVTSLIPSSKYLGTVVEELQLSSVFDHYFSKDFFYRFEETTKETVLETLVSSFYRDASIDHTKTMLDLIQQREKMSTVIFNDAIAVPHPLKALDSTHRIGVGLVPKGVYWNEDYPNIQLIFLVSPSVGDNQGLSLITQRFVDLTEESETIKQLVGCRTFEAFKNILLRESGSL